MSRKSLVKMADILSAAGYSTPLILAAIGYPFCVSVRQIKPPSQVTALSNLKIEGFQIDGRMESLELPKTENRIEWKKPKIPQSEYIKLNGQSTIGFSFSDNSSISLLVLGQANIPNPMRWPTPSFLKNRKT
jgi:hypothetical protein